MVDGRECIQDAFYFCGNTRPTLTIIPPAGHTNTKYYLVAYLVASDFGTIPEDDRFAALNILCRTEVGSKEYVRKDSKLATHRKYNLQEINVITGSNSYLFIR